MKKSTLSYKSLYEWKSVLVIYYIQNQSYIEKMKKIDDFSWELHINENDDIKYYAFLLDNKFWDIDLSRDYILIEQLPFSIHYKKRKDQKIALIHAVICKGIDKELLTPINPSKNFNSLDQTINILYKLEFNLTSILIRIEVINPHKEVVIYDYTELILNDVKYEQTAFMCVPVLPQMEVGEWIINLICQDQIIFSQSFYYRELRSYTNKYQSYYAINTDYKV